MNVLTNLNKANYINDKTLTRVTVANIDVNSTGNVYFSIEFKYVVDVM